MPSLVSIQLKLKKKKVHEELKSELKQSICRDDYFILHGPILYLFLPPFLKVFIKLVEDSCIFLLNYLVEFVPFCLYVNKCCTFCNTF